MGRTHGKNTEIVLQEIKKFHGNLLFDKFEYINSNTKVIIGCNIHGYFSKYPNDMKNGRGGCPRCNKSFTRSADEFISELEKIHPHLRCLDSYKNSKIKLNFICCLHNYSFISQPYTVLAGHINCPECYSSKQTATKIKKGQISDPALKSEYEIFRRNVWRFSNRTYKIHLSEQKRDRHNHLDHLLSIVDGFKYKVPAEIMGSIHNLRIISGQANRHKSYRSEITVEQLLRDYNK